MQYKQITAWQCNQCKRVLLTMGEVRRHMQKCKYVEPIEDGQMSMEQLEVNLSCKTQSKAQ